jgi:hypothetical protein
MIVHKVGYHILQGKSSSRDISFLVQVYWHSSYTLLNSQCYVRQMGLTTKIGRNQQGMTLQADPFCDHIEGTQRWRVKVLDKDSGEAAVR